MNINGKLYLGPAGPHKGKEQGVFQPDQTAADLLFPGGTHRSTVFFSAEKAGKYQSCGAWHDGGHDAAVFFAMYEKNGEPLEVILFHFIEARIIRPKIRVYRTDNFYAALMRQAQAEKEVEEIVRKYQRPVPEKREKKISGTGISEK
jgi:hypothetical protein